MSDSDTIDRLIAVGRPDLAERLKHLAGKHNQARHGWRFAKGGDDAARLGAARRSMRGRDAGERAEYRKRAGMPSAERIPNPGWKNRAPKSSRFHKMTFEQLHNELDKNVAIQRKFNRDTEQYGGYLDFHKPPSFFQKKLLAERDELTHLLWG